MVGPEPKEKDQRQAEQDNQNRPNLHDQTSWKARSGVIFFLPAENNFEPFTDHWIINLPHLRFEDCYILMNFFISAGLHL